jgi:two-component system sensor histidine kinase PilS (NtrC family)
MADGAPDADTPERRRGERRRGGDRRVADRRQGDRRQRDRRQSDRRTSTGADFAASWFAAIGMATDSRPHDDAESRFAPGWSAADTTDSRFLSRQARRIVGSGPTAFQRIHRTFLAARAALGIALLVAIVVGNLLGVRTATLPLVLSSAYALQALAVWLWPRRGGDAHAGSVSRLGRGQWLATIGVDLLAFSTLYLLEPSPNLNYVALLVLPVLMAGVLTPRLSALGTAAAVTLLLLANGWRLTLGGVELTAAMTPAGLTGIGLFIVTLLAGELAGRLAREERTARGSLEIARQQAQLNRLVIDEMGEGVLVIDRRARVRTANPAARRLLVADGLAPTPPFSLRSVPAWRALTQAVEQAFREASWPEGGRDVQLDFGAGASRMLRLRVRFTRRRAADEAGDADSPTSEELCVLFLEDVRTVVARTRQEKLAAMGRMSAGIAHEIRNPLAAIAQANALLREDLTAPGQQRLATMVADNVERLKRIVDDVLEVAAGAAATPREIDAAAEVAAIAHDWAATASLAPGAGGRLALELDAGPLPVWFDPDHLRRVLVNLLDNARRHASAEAGAIVLRLARASPGEVELVVASDGEPIAPDVERYLFEPFFSTRSRGTGLGLYICRELCERYGAAIDYRQRPAGHRHRNEFVITMRAAAAPERA